MSDLNEFLAREVMGEAYSEDAFGGRLFSATTGELIYNHWNPRENIAQAVECAKALPMSDGIELHFYPDGVVVASVLFSRRRNEALALAETESRALATAVARAAGWQG